MDETKLDNPVFYSLSETHRKFSVDFGDIKFYHPDYCAFGGFHTTENISHHIVEYSKLADNFFIVGNKPELPAGFKLKTELVCLQMIIYNKITIESKEKIVTLSNDHAESLFRLVTSVFPGYFKRKTFLLGDYFGIFKNGKLISVTGERMIMNDFVEVSAVVTHPQHTRQGYSKQLIVHTINNVLNQGKTAYLHVAEPNTGAIRLYETLGFTTRRKISFWNITK